MGTKPYWCSCALTIWIGRSHLSTCLEVSTHFIFLQPWGYSLLVFHYESKSESDAWLSMWLWSVTHTKSEQMSLSHSYMALWYRPHMRFSQHFSFVESYSNLHLISWPQIGRQLSLVVSEVSANHTILVSSTLPNQGERDLNRQGGVLWVWYTQPGLIVPLQPVNRDGMEV